MGVAVPSNRMGGAALRTDVAVAIAAIDPPPNEGDDDGGDDDDNDDDVVVVVVVVRQTASLTSVKVKGNTLDKHEISK